MGRSLVFVFACELLSFSSFRSVSWWQGGFVLTSYWALQGISIHHCNTFCGLDFCILATTGLVWWADTRFPGIAFVYRFPARVTSVSIANRDWLVLGKGILGRRVVSWWAFGDGWCFATCCRAANPTKTDVFAKDTILALPEIQRL